MPPTPTLDQMYQLSIQLEKYSIYFTNLISDKLLNFIHLRSNFHFGVGVGVGVGVNDSNHPKCMRRSTVFINAPVFEHSYKHKHTSNKTVDEYHMHEHEQYYCNFQIR